MAYQLQEINRRVLSDVEEFLAEEIAPLLEKYPDESLQAELNV